MRGIPGIARNVSDYQIGMPECVRIGCQNVSDLDARIGCPDWDVRIGCQNWMPELDARIGCPDWDARIGCPDVSDITM